MAARRCRRRWRGWPTIARCGSACATCSRIRTGSATRWRSSRSRGAWIRGRSSPSRPTASWPAASATFAKTDVERIGAEVGYWLGRAFWGRGIATAALRLLTAHAFAADPELRRLWAVPFVTNVASARVLEKAGYTREGTLRQSAIKDGRVLDQFMYAILRDEALGL